MARRWTIHEEKIKRDELQEPYIMENKTIGEIAKILELSEIGIYDRLVRLSIPTIRAQKVRYNNQRIGITLPDKYTPLLAEFVGLMLGDGHLTPTQVTITLWKKDITSVMAEFI